MNEDQNIEYKQSWRDEYLKWICGFANATGGKIYIGIDDNGQVVGVEDAKKLMEDIPNKIVNFLGIVADVNTMEMFLGKHASKPYNKNIADIFFKAGFIEAWGRGISKIMKGFADAGMELPTFEFSMGGLWVVMKRKVFGEVTPQVSVPVTAPVTAPVIMEILNSKEYVNSFIYLFSEKQECSSREIMEAWGLLSLRYVRLNYITPLLKAGILRLKYPDNPNHPQQRYLLNEIK